MFGIPWHSGHHSPRSKLLWSAQDELTEALTLLQQLRDDREKQVEENKRLAEENASLNQNNLQLRDDKEVILNQNNQLRLRSSILSNPSSAACSNTSSLCRMKSLSFAKTFAKTLAKMLPKLPKIDRRLAGLVCDP